MTCITVHYSDQVSYHERMLVWRGCFRNGIVLVQDRYSVSVYTAGCSKWDELTLIIQNRGSFWETVVQSLFTFSRVERCPVCAWVCVCASVWMCGGAVCTCWLDTLKKVNNCFNFLILFTKQHDNDLRCVEACLTNSVLTHSYTEIFPSIVKGRLPKWVQNKTLRGISAAHISITA